MQCGAQIRIGRSKVAAIAGEKAELHLQIHIVRVIADGILQQLERLVLLAVMHEQGGLQPRVLRITAVILLLLGDQRIRFVELAVSCQNAGIRNLDRVALGMLRGEVFIGALSLADLAGPLIEALQHARAFEIIGEIVRGLHDRLLGGSHVARAQVQRGQCGARLQLLGIGCDRSLQLRFSAVSRADSSR